MQADVAAILDAQAESGAILACPDFPTYRFSWLRDGAFCAVALDTAGETDAARRFHDWATACILSFEPPMRRAIEAMAVGEPVGADDFLPCRFSAGGRAPNGDGWGAFQMDGPGLWLWALDHHARAGGGASGLGPGLQRTAALTAEYVSAMWRQPSYDAWEEHGDRLASSTLAACLAGLLAAHRLGLELAGMRDAVDGLRGELAARARHVGYLPRSDADPAVDASILWCGPLLGAFHRDDRGWTATLERVEAELVGTGGGVYRFAADTFYGGGQWPVLTAAYGLACLRRDGPGDRERARGAADWIERLRDPRGSLPEQSTDHPLHPERVAEWEARWGPVARPLTWSHALLTLLRAALDESGVGER